MSIHHIKLLSFLKPKTFILTLLFLGLSTVFLSRGAFANVTPKTDEGTENSIPGGTRGTPCFSGKKNTITPLVPKKNKKPELKVTLVSHPKMFIYVPENKAIVGEFILKDSSQKKVYQNKALLPESQGIINIKIPREQPELKVGTTYNWKLRLICETPSRRSRMEGSIPRVNPSKYLTKKLQ